jgi:hypothetical protein
VRRALHAIEVVVVILAIGAVLTILMMVAGII